MDIFIIIAIIVGFAIGVLSSLIGVGGGTVMVPFFRLAFDFPALMATATSLFAILPTSIAGVASRWKHKSFNIPIGVIAGIGGACTSVLGVWLASISPSILVMFVAAVVILYSAFNMFKKAFAKPNNKKATGASSSTDSGPATTGSNVLSVQSLNAEFFKNVAPKALLIGVIAGVISGYIGVGGGFIMVPLFNAWLKLSMKNASGTSLIGICILAIPALVEQFMLGNVNLAVGVAIAIGSIPGATVGTRISERISEKGLRIIFACFLSFAAVLLLVREIGLF